MKFLKISALVPTGEPFDEKAVNEGVWMSEAHLTSIENSLTLAENGANEAAATLASVSATLETKNASLVTLTEEIAAQKVASEKLTAEKAAAEQKITDQETAHATAISEKDAKITALEAEVVKLGKAPSGTGSTVAATEDETVTETSTGKPGLLDPEHPLNQFAAAKIANSKKAKL